MIYVITFTVLGFVWGCYVGCHSGNILLKLLQKGIKPHR